MAVIMYAGNKNSGEVYDLKIAQLIADGKPLPGFEEEDEYIPVNLARGVNCSRKEGK